MAFCRTLHTHTDASRDNVTAKLPQLVDGWEAITTTACKPVLKPISLSKVFGENGSHRNKSLHGCSQLATVNMKIQFCAHIPRYSTRDDEALVITQSDGMHWLRVAGER